MGIIKEAIKDKIDLEVGLLALDLIDKADKKRFENRLQEVFDEFKENTNQKHFFMKYNKDYTYTLFDKNFKKNVISKEKK